MTLRPDLTGTLARYELYPLLRALRGERFTGRVSLTAPDDAIVLFLEQGSPVHARSLQTTFAGWLTATGRLTGSSAQKAQARAEREQVTFEEAVAVSGLMESADVLTARELLVYELFSRAFGLTPAVYEAWRVGPPPRHMPRVELDLDIAFFRFLADRDSPEVQARELAGREALHVVPTWSFVHREQAYRSVFGDKDPVIERILQPDATLSELLSVGDDRRAVVTRVFALHRAGLVRFEPTTATPEALHTWDEVMGDLAPAVAASFVEVDDAEESAQSDHDRILEAAAREREQGSHKAGDSR